MNITVTDQEHCKKQVKLEIPSETVKKEIDKVATQLSRKVTLAGFRPGHVPKSVIMTRFKKELRDEVASKIIPDAFDSAIHERGLKVVGEPELEEFKFGDDETLNISLVVEVAPEFALIEFKGLPLRKKVYKVTDEDVTRALNSLREREAEMAPVEDRPSQAGDFVSASVKGSIQPSEEGGEVESVDQRDIEVDLGNSNIFEEFRTALIGVQTGETKEFSVTYPADLGNKRLAGKLVNYSGEITAVRVKQLPELNDDFASQVDEEVKTLDELKNKIRLDLEHQAEHRTELELRESLRKDLLDKHKFEVPQRVVEKQAEARVRNFARQLAQQRIDLGSMRLDWDTLFDKQTELAEEEVRWAFILNRIAVAENIEVTDEDVDKEIEKLAETSGKSAAALKANLTKENGLASIKEQLENRRAIDTVIASADIVTEEVEGLGGDSVTEGEGRTANDSEILAEGSDAGAAAE